MQIETYEIEEDLTSEATEMAKDATAIALINELGLEGQQSLVNNETLTRDPYPRMNALQSYVYKVQCPESTHLGDFKSGLIPLRVLQVASHCINNTNIKNLEVWHPADVREDPLLVGRTEKESQYSQNPFLLARWGETLLSFDVLIVRAKKVFKAKYRAEIKKHISSLTNIQNDAHIDTLFDRGSFSIPYLCQLEG